MKSTNKIHLLPRNVAGGRYVIETDGLLIKQISRPDGGTYTCRARVPQTGELEERNIVLDVSLSLMSWKNSK